ncbi:MAG: hypothetical protein MUD12_14350 [Spirochaetes bacterium]|jgi:hypothetical protein|nr:hypothetical protein [Spirochaetota bacterium]
MKKINDSKLYFYFGAATLAISIITAAVSAYSVFSVERETERLLSAGDKVNEQYKKAYLMIRDPQVFAGLDNFDASGMSVKNSIIYFDKKIASGSELEPADRSYLEIILDRRKKGSRLGINTAAFLLLVSGLGWAMFFYERKSNS